MGMNLQGEQVVSILLREDFWIGVFASVMAAGICAIIALIARNAIKTAIDRRRQGKREEELLIYGLLDSTDTAPFAFGLVQARALRHLVVAIFISYIADIFSFIWPFNLIIYAVALVLLYMSLRWFFKIERSGLALLNGGN